jgi:hypothetical protein
VSATVLPATGLPRAEDWEPCSNRSLERDDPLIGTSGLGERWFLVEIDGAWGRHALLQSRLDPELAHRLVNRIERARMRPLAIRRPGRRADESRRQSSWRWAIVDARPGQESVGWGVVDDPWQLLEIPLDGSTGIPSADPIVCVCTQARHDQCCAVRGRPTLKALVAVYPDITWECSHLGGDRFAATMMIFPEALHFGRVTADAAAGVVDSYRDGVIADEFFRGRAALPNAVQAADAYARAAVGDDRIRAFTLLDQEGADGVWSVRLAHGASVVSVDLHETLSVPLLSTCTAVVPVRVREFALDHVTVAR